MKTSLFVQHNGKTEGPFSNAQIRSLIQAGSLPSDALSAAEGDAEWRPLKLNLDRDADPNSPARRNDLPAGQVVGIFLLLGALGALAYALSMDVSVPVSGFGRVNNLGLMSDRQTFLILGGIGAIIGTLLILLCRRPGRPR